MSEDVDVQLAAAAPPAFPSSPPDGVAPPPGLPVPLADLPAPVAVTAAPGGLPDGLCVSSTSSSSSSPAAASGPAPSLGVSAELEGSPQWGVIAPTNVGGVGAGAGHDFVLLLKKDVQRGGPLQVTRPMVAAEPCGPAKEAARFQNIKTN
nr:forkhead box protein F2-like [Procambarus clarkii]